MGILWELSLWLPNGKSHQGKVYESHLGERFKKG